MTNIHDIRKNLIGASALTHLERDPQYFTYFMLLVSEPRSLPRWRPFLQHCGGLAYPS